MAQLNSFGIAINAMVNSGAESTSISQSMLHQVFAAVINWDFWNQNRKYLVSSSMGKMPWEVN